MGVWDITIMVLSRDEEDFNNRCTRVEILSQCGEVSELQYTYGTKNMGLR